MLTRFAITRRADNDGVDASVAERDYVLAHIVAQLHRAKPTDGGQLVFKGGTALRLVHIDDYRYSADLDFTIIGGSARAATAAMVEVLNAAREYAEFPVLELTDSSPVRLLRSCDRLKAQSSLRTQTGSRSASLSARPVRSCWAFPLEHTH